VIVNLLTAVLLFSSLLAGLSHFSSQAVSGCLPSHLDGEQCSLIDLFDSFKAALASSCMLIIIFLLLLSSRYLVLVMYVKKWDFRCDYYFTLSIRWMLMDTKASLIYILFLF